jgi:hypothetical protein
MTTQDEEALREFLASWVKENVFRVYDRVPELVEELLRGIRQHTAHPSEAEIAKPKIRYCPESECIRKVFEPHIYCDKHVDSSSTPQLQSTNKAKEGEV